MTIDLPTTDDPVRLIQGDCLDVLPGLESAGVDCVLTDPPYGVELGTKNDKRRDGSHLGKRGYLSDPDTYEAFVSGVVPRLNAYISAAKRAAVFTGPNIHEQMKPDAIGGIYCPCAVGRTSWGFKSFLPILFYGVAPELHKGHRPTVLVSTVMADKNGHPCPKPVEWMRWLIRLSTRPGELVLDPFAGSGTTGVAAMLEGRRAVLIEREPQYCDIIRKRLAHASGTAPGSLFAGVRT